MASPGGATEGDRRVIDYRWELVPLQLKPGTQLTFYATASDYRPQTAKSEPRRLMVITAAELQDRLAGREKLILAELERARKMQRGCRTQIESLQARLAQSPHFKQADVDNLQAAQNGQRDATRLLTSRSEGVPMHVLALLADMENNRTDGGDLGRRMASLLAEIERLEREHLPEIERGTTSAVKTAQAALEGQGRAGGAEKTVAAALAEVGTHQDAVIAAIERLLGQLARWDSFRRFQSEIGQLFRNQEDVTRRTSELGRATLTRELRELPPQEVADLKAAAVRQLELARLLDRLLQEMEEAVGELRGHDPSTAKTAADAVDEARRLALSEQMRTAGGRIQQNQIGQAAAAQKQIIDGLQAVLDMLANHRQQEVARLDETIKRLRHKQEEILSETKRFGEIERSQGELTRAQAVALRNVAQSQHKLQAVAAQLVPRLAGAMGPVVADAADEMHEAGGLLDQRQVGPATQTVQLSVMRRFDRLLEALSPDETIAQGESPGGGQAGSENAANGSGPTLADLKLLKLLQQDINVRTLGLQQAIGPSPKPSDEQAGRCAELSEGQGRLADIMRQLVRPPQEEQGPPVEIAREMRNAQRRIKQTDLGLATQTLQGRIVAELDALIQQARKTAKSSSSSAGPSQPAVGAHARGPVTVESRVVDPSQGRHKSDCRQVGQVERGGNAG